MDKPEWHVAVNVRWQALKSTRWILCVISVIHSFVLLPIHWIPCASKCHESGWCGDIKAFPKLQVSSYHRKSKFLHKALQKKKLVWGAIITTMEGWQWHGNKWLPSKPASVTHIHWKFLHNRRRQSTVPGRSQALQNRTWLISAFEDINALETRCERETSSFNWDKMQCCSCSSEEKEGQSSIAISQRPTWHGHEV